jgi:hypothetical protein
MRTLDGGRAWDAVYSQRLPDQVITDPRKQHFKPLTVNSGAWHDEFCA